MKNNTLNIIQIFGHEKLFIYPLIESIEKEMPNFEYRFMAKDKYEGLKRTYYKDDQMFMDVSKMNKVYWEEILMRVQWGCFTSLMRTKRWLESIAVNYETNNYVGFCSSLRGLIESSADSYYVFKATPLHIADIFGSIKVALTEKYENVFFQSKTFEDYLIHFTHGRIDKHKKPKSHNAKSMKTYIETLDKSTNSNLYDLWKKLCSIVHPSSETVFMFSEAKETKAAANIKLNTKMDKNLISELIENNKGNLHIAFATGVYPLLWCLKILNLLKFEELKCKSIEGIAFSQWEQWNNIESKINYTESNIPKKKDLILKKTAANNGYK